MVRSVTVATGAASSALLLFLAKQTGGRCFAGFVAGAVAGFVIGLILSRLLYSAGNGSVQVVKAAPENLPVTLTAAWRGAVCQTVFILIGLGLFGKTLSWPVVAATALGANLLIAFGVARLSVIPAAGEARR